MTDDSDLIELYSKRILALAASIPHVGNLDNPQGSASRRSPLCGSIVAVDLCLHDGRISEFAQDVKACALGQAAASVVGKNILGRTYREVARGRDDLAAMLAGENEMISPPFAELDVLLPARAYQNRHSSILLSLDATLAAMDAAQTAD